MPLSRARKIALSRFTLFALGLGFTGCATPPTVPLGKYTTPEASVSWFKDLAAKTDRSCDPGLMVQLQATVDDNSERVRRMRACEERLKSDAVGSVLSSSKDLAQTLKGYRLCNAEGEPASKLPAPETVDICQDLRKWYCSQDLPLLDSKCRYTSGISPEDFLAAPTASNLACRSGSFAARMWTKFPEFKRNFCSGWGSDDNACEAVFKGLLGAEVSNDVDEYVRNQNDVKTRLQSDLDGLRQAAKRVIARSPKLKDDHRGFIEKQLDALKLEIGGNATFIENPDITQMLQMDARYSPFTNEIRVENGILANIEAYNPYSYLQLLSHEVAHSFSQCAYEFQNFFQGNPVHAEKAGYFDGLMKNLRGGGGANGCEGGRIRCGSEVDFQKSCLMFQDKEFCEKLVASTPSCGNWSRRVQTESDEAFADALGNEILAEYLKDKVKPGSPEALDVMIGVASFYADTRGCQAVKNHLSDPHPDLEVRLNRLFLHNEKIRERVGCPKTLNSKESTWSVEAF